MQRSKILVPLHLVTATVLGFSGCSDGSSPETAAMEPPAMYETALASVASDNVGPTVPGADTAAPRARIVTLTLTMTVDDVEDAADLLRRYAESHEGYVERADVSASGASSANLALRMPEGTLSETRVALRELGEVTREQESIEDVTMARADVNARLRNARAHETRLLAIVSDRTGTLADLIEAERELSRVREVIEQIDAEQRALEGRIAFAYVNVELTEAAEATHQTSFVDHPIDAVVNGAEMGVRATYTIMVTGVVVVAAVAPSVLTLAFLAFLLYGFVRIVRRLRRRRAPEADASPTPTAF